MGAQAKSTGSAFGRQLKHWRGYRKQSQLELALAAGVSQRHLSWLETGRSQPSRAMVLALSETLDVPLRERNELLQSAGFAAFYQERPMDAPDMVAVNDALTRMLKHHEPFPALVVDRLWNLRMTNAAADALIRLAGDPDELWARVGDDGSRNLARLTLHPEGLRPMIANWAAAGPAFIRRLQREAASSGAAAERALVDEMLTLVAPEDLRAVEPDAELLPTLPLELVGAGLTVKLFSVLSTFGTPQDLTTDEIRVELMFPADAASEMLLRHMSQIPA